MAKTTTIQAPITAKWRKLAENCSSVAGERLTPARLSAYAEMLACKRPVSAYELIALLEDRQQRKIAPLTVYRHLDFLIRVGLVHRLESTQSYLPCEHPGHTHESQYLLCSSCGQVDEVESKSMGSLVQQMADERGFQPESVMIEIQGRCATCSAKPSE